MWHDIAAKRFGNVLELTADDGDRELQRLSQEEEMSSLAAPVQWRDEHLWGADAPHPGGKSPRSVGEKPVIHTNFKEGCLDDVRVNGRRLPMPPALNATRWGAVEAALDLASGCVPPSACVNATCSPPYKCLDTWKQFTCDCGEGFQLSPDGSSCLDVDECRYEPCLNFASCSNSVPGYHCSCTSGYAGHNCEQQAGPLAFPLGGLPVLLAFTFSLAAVLGLLAIAVSTYFLRRRKLELKTTSVDGAASKQKQQQVITSTIIDSSNLSPVPSKESKKTISIEEPSSDKQFPKESMKNMTLFSKPSSKNAALSKGLQRKSSSSKESFSCEGINSVAGHAIEVRYTASAATHTTLAPSVCELHALQHDAVPCLGRSNPDAVPCLWRSNPDAVPCLWRSNPDAGPCLGRSNPDAVPCLGRSNPDLTGEDVTKSGHAGPLNALTLMAPRGYRDEDEVQHNKLRDVI
ncbi:protocadherin Fat 3-like, partial [Hyalella azteca]|uniref:Protocadherin Fat 3-like n=1 Tax=Hyalella azteca TaxID=294128 RepID=A0A979FTB6_HYAAZ